MLAMNMIVTASAATIGQIDGLALFYCAPDWRTMQFEFDIPSVKGKMGLMPMPAWEPGGRRTTTWGGTGLTITKQCKDPDLAWKLAMYLYYDKDQLGPRFAETNILPPLKSAWDLPQFNAPRPFYSGIALGRAYAQLAPQVPEENDNPFMMQGRDKFSEAFANASIYYADHGERGLREYTRAELKRCADRVRELIARNVFLKQDDGGEKVNAKTPREDAKVQKPIASSSSSSSWRSSLAALAPWRSTQSMERPSDRKSVV